MLALVALPRPAVAVSASKALVPLEPLVQACQDARQRGDIPTLREQQRALLRARPAPQPLAVVLANADALLVCGAPDSALVVLTRFSPAPGAEQQQWLLMQWRAANASLDHRLAIKALRQLAAVSAVSLEQLQLPVGAELKTQAAIDLLAGHLDALGLREQAAQVLFASRTPGVATAQRLAQAVAWSASLPREQRLQWLERALEQAAAAGAWGLAVALLDQQLPLLDGQPGPALQKVQQRRQRLAQRLDDAAALNPRAVRSPRDAGGHAASRQP